uniref:Plastid lipid-associated protein/fibrillin conserved domain-containing protein n=2 Tax=Aegilops tauschii subsp. strangulata TaxID=200361 RepID=A0A452ZEY8_AEGTS
GAPPIVRAAVSAVTELLRALSPKKPRQAVEAVDAELESPRSVEEVVAVLEADYRRAYFLTGNFTLDIYAEDCLFEDPTIKFRGRSRYSQNLDLLVPFFDSPSLQLENIDKGLRVDTKFIIATWTLRTYLKLPWRPLIAIRGNTTYDLDEEYKVALRSRSLGTQRVGTSLRWKRSDSYSSRFRSKREADLASELWNN